MRQLQQSIKHRRDVFNILMWTTLGGGLLFGTLNLLHGSWLLAAIELSYACFSLAMLQIIKRSSHFKRWVIIYVTIFFCIMMFAFAAPKSTVSVFAWGLTIPVISYLLLGRKMGLIYSLVFIFTGVFIYHWHFYYEDPLSSVISVLNIAVSSFAVMLFSHIYELNREKNEARLILLAGTDALTSVANRTKLPEAFFSLSKRSKRDSQTLSLVLIDLDHFKKINDQYGHDAGDKALCYCARHFEQVVPVNGLLARVGGEEFALIHLSEDSEQVIEDMAQLSRNMAAAPFNYNGQSISITFSAGVSVLNVDGDSLDSLLMMADKRLYIAKKNGRNRVEFSASVSID